MPGARYCAFSSESQRSVESLFGSPAPSCARKRYIPLSTACSVRSISWLRVPVRVRRPAPAGKALSFAPQVQTCRANSTCVKRVPDVSAGTRPEVFLSRRPAAQRAPDAWAGWLAVSLDLVPRHNGGSIGLRTHSRASRTPTRWCLVFEHHEPRGYPILSRILRKGRLRC